jgi:hypothetical protein
MAFNIGADTVISNARQLSNIASLDATTTATISAALPGSGNFSATLLYTLDNPNVYISTVTNDQFGAYVASDGKYLAISGHNEDFGASSSGTVYVYNMLTGKLIHIFNNPAPVASDVFGTAIDISGNWLLVGAPGDDGTGSGSGIAFIFNISTGALHKTLNNPNAYSTSASDGFGNSVAISGNYAIVGARDEDDAGGTTSGKAYIFNVTTGALLFTLNNPNAYGTSASDSFTGYDFSMDADGDYLIAGARDEDDAGGTTSGKAYIFNVTTGTLLATLDNPNAYGTSASDQFGNACSISGNYAIVGAWQEDEAGGTGSGKAYVYKTTNGLWTDTTLYRTISNPNAYSTVLNDGFAFKVGISGSYAAIGTSGEDDANGTGSGKAYIFNVITGTLLATLDNPNAYGTSTDDGFDNVAISGNYLAVAAANEDEAGGTSSGKVYIYSLIDQTSSVTREELAAIL